jgi:C1A family cysteine protease
MPSFEPQGFDWQADLADHRDYSWRHQSVASLLATLRSQSQRTANLPRAVDWREYCGPIEDQLGLGTSAAHAAIALVQYFERRSTGRMLRLSSLFAHYTAGRLMPGAGGRGVSLRAVLKAMVLCGIPPERVWPYAAARLNEAPDAFAYTFGRYFRSICYLRLDSRGASGDQVLRQVRAFLAAGLPAAFGFPVCDAVGDDGEIPLPKAINSVLGGQAMTAVGYDDNLRIGSDRGALLVRSCWGNAWGHGGYGWLPYAYVRERLAIDFWTLLKPAWLRSGEFELPL